MNDTFPHDTSGGAVSAITVRGRSGSTVGPSGSHYIIGPLQKTSGPRKKEKTAMSHFWDTHHKRMIPFTRVAQNARGVVKGVVKGVTRASFGRRTSLTPQLKRASARRREEHVFRGVYGACPKIETCAFSEGLTHHCTGSGGVG